MNTNPKFSIGSVVRYTHAAFDPSAAGEAYRVIERMKLQGIEFEYRIHPCSGLGERVVRESQLRASA